MVHAVVKIIGKLYDPQDSILCSGIFTKNKENIDEPLMFILAQPNVIAYVYCKSRL